MNIHRSGRLPTFAATKNTVKKRLVLLASGNGSNVSRLIDHFDGSKQVEVSHVISNRTSAGVLKLAEKADVPATVISGEGVRSGQLLSFLSRLQPDLIVLAGYLLLIPAEVVEKYGDKMINLHPSLLPAYGGKGMYGSRVLQAVLDNKEEETGITIHCVNAAFDEGEIIAQFRCEVKAEDTLESLQKRIQSLEHRHLPEVVEKLLK